MRSCCLYIPRKTLFPRFSFRFFSTTRRRSALTLKRPLQNPNSFHAPIMPASKLSRIVRSSSQGDTGLFSHVRPIESPEDLCLKKRAITGRPKPAPNPVAKKSSSPPLLKQKQLQPLKSVLTLGSSTIFDDEVSKNKKSADEGFGDFLKACSLCKKKLLVEKDVYMYGYLNAFCSAECREDRIALDGFEKQVSLESTKLITGRSKRLHADPPAGVCL